MTVFALRLLLSALVVLFLALVIYLMTSSTVSSRTKKACLEIERQLADKRQELDLLDHQFQLVRENVMHYINIVSKHGPDSPEAQAFLFAMDSPMMQELSANHKTLIAFSEQVEVVNETFRKLVKKG